MYKMRLRPFLTTITIYSLSQRNALSPLEIIIGIKRITKMLKHFLFLTGLTLKNELGFFILTGN